MSSRLGPRLPLTRTGCSVTEVGVWLFFAGIVGYTLIVGYILLIIIADGIGEHDFVPLGMVASCALIVVGYILAVRG